jgi:eukaryotic-like serine/threonine-protein kinase
VSVDTATPAGSAGSVGDRYRLLECVAGDPEGPAVAWRAWDMLLNRPVTLTVVRPGGPAAVGFLSHAHTISTIAHPALARVYDAVDESTRAYVVSEWVTGTPLTALLREGPLEPDVAASTVGRVAEGVAAAHSAGLAFGGVHPDHVVVTQGGTVTLAQVVGDGRAAAADDVRGLGALLYASLTAHWPLTATGGAATLRPATLNGSHLLTPRQARAGVPEALSTLAMRTLDQSGPHSLRSAAAMASLLAERASPPDEVFPFTGEPAPRRQRPRWVALAIPVAAALVALALIGWLVGTALGRFPRNNGPSAGGNTVSTGPSSQPRTSAEAAPPQPVTPVGAALYDPQGDGAEARKLQLSYDGQAGTSWSTDAYKRNANFGNLKKGMGIAYDMGSSITLRQIKIVTDQPGSDVQILAGDLANASDPAAYQVVGQATGLQQSQTITLSTAKARYYIVWITKLVPNQNGGFSASLSEVTFVR